MNHDQPVVPSRGLVIVHVSDIHFHFKQNVGHLDRDGDIAHQLILDAPRIVASLGVCHGVWVNGDIAYTGKAEEYALAKAWLRELCGGLGCDPLAIWVVPGNHDVERAIPPAVRDDLISVIRNRDPARANDTLRGYLEGEDSHLFFRYMSKYNEFAGSYQCAVDASRPAWQQDFPLNDGSTLRLHGLTSTLCSNNLDDVGAHKLALGEFQLTGLREDPGVVHAVMCHHPPNWLLDAREVEQQLNARARLQMFGHEHEEVHTRINDSLRLVAGAVKPQRGRDWEPRYSILELTVQRDGTNRTLSVRVFSRTWDPTQRQFVSAAGEQPRVYVLPLPNWDPPHPPSTLDESLKSDTMPGTERILPSEENLGPLVLAMRPERILANRFFDLSYSVRLEIAVKLGLCADEDQGIGDPELTRRYFERARHKRSLGQLWEELSKRLDVAEEPNPFSDPPSQGAHDA